jgi:hypothetical protein
MKTLLSLQNGAITITEQAGVITLSFSEALGGGEAAGIVKGSGSIVLNAQQGLQMGEKLLNAHIPASLLPLVTVVEGVVNQALASVE